MLLWAVSRVCAGLERGHLTTLQGKIQPNSLQLIWRLALQNVCGQVANAHLRHNPTFAPQVWPPRIALHI